MKRRVISFFSAMLLALSCFPVSAQAANTKTHTVIGSFSYEDGMSANYKVSIPYFLGALEVKLPLFDYGDGTLSYEDSAVYVLCPPDGEDASITVQLTGPSCPIYTSVQTRAYLEYDGVKLSPLYDGGSGMSSQKSGDLFFPSTGLYEGLVFFDYSIEELDYVYSADIPAELASSLSHFCIGCDYVLVLDRESIADFLETEALEGYEGVAFTGLAELLSGKLPANLITDNPDFDHSIDRDEYRPASASMDNFRAASGYTPGQFSDVSDQWFADAVAKVCALGLMKGRGDGTFQPDGNVTLAEVITMAVRLNSIYRGLGDSFPSDVPWYQPYRKYALAHDIIDDDDFPDLDAPATRAQMAGIFADALPAHELAPINDVPSLPDVSDDDGRSPYGEEVFLLYRAGVLAGSDGSGAFHPDTPITRAEVAAVMIRMALPDERLPLSFPA